MCNPPCGIAYFLHLRHRLHALMLTRRTLSSPLQVRQDKTAIDFGLLREAIDKRRLGLPSVRLPPSEAKLRMATVQAARAVAVCTTMGLPPVVHVSIQPRGGVMSRIVFMPQVRAHSSGSRALLHALHFVKTILWSTVRHCYVRPRAACAPRPWGQHALGLTPSALLIVTGVCAT